MSLLDNISLLITPNAVKASKLYSVIPNTDLGDLVVVRNTTATRINSAGNTVVEAANIARIDYTVLTRPGILIEPQRTNRLLNSATVTNQSITTTAITNILSFTGTGTITLSGTFSGSLVGTGVNDIVSLVFTTTAGTLNIAVSGSCTRGQITDGALLTSNIPTTNASVTRNADNISKTGVSSLIGQTEGVIFVHCDYVRTDSSVGARKLISLNDGSSNNLIDIFIPGGLNTMFARVRAGAAGFGSISTSAVPTGRIKLAYAYKANDYALFINGSLIEAVTTGGEFTFSAAVSVIQLGDGEADGDEFGGSIYEKGLFKTRLTNAQLITLTTL